MLAININNIEYIELLLNELSIFTPTKLITISLLDRCSLNSAQYNQIVFIDSSVKDYENLTNNFTQPTEFIILDSQQDGLAQITHHLSQYDSIDAIHIVSHGDAGQLLLGNTNLNKDTLFQYVDILNSWSDFLTKEADILLYVCNVAKNLVGIAFVP